MLALAILTHRRREPSVTGTSLLGSQFLSLAGVIARQPSLSPLPARPIRPLSGKLTQRSLASSKRQTGEPAVKPSVSLLSLQTSSAAALSSPAPKISLHSLIDLLAMPVFNFWRWVNCVGLRSSHFPLAEFQLHGFPITACSNSSL